MGSPGTSTHEQRRAAKAIKDEWTAYIVNEERTFEDLVKAASGDSTEATYLATLRLCDLVAKVHPAMTMPQVLALLSELPIKSPSNPAKFTVRSIRARRELVEQVSAMLRSSAVTKNARGRTDVPATWPWGSKLSDLIKAAGEPIPHGLAFLEGDDDSVEDLLLSDQGVEGPDLSIRATPTVVEASEKVADSEVAHDDSEVSAPDESEASAPEGTATAFEPDEQSPQHTDDDSGAPAAESAPEGAASVTDVDDAPVDADGALAAIFGSEMDAPEESPQAEAALGDDSVDEVLRLISAPSAASAPEPAEDDHDEILRVLMGEGS